MFFMKDAYLLIGGNLGERSTYLEEAKKLISLHCGTITESSSLYETAAWGNRMQPSFLNQVIQLHTILSPEALMKTILLIEEKMGRVRKEKNSERIIDIDILYYGDRVIQEEGLTIPHPRIAERRFVLVPFAERWPGFVDPSNNNTISEMLDLCTDDLEVTKFQTTT